MASLLHKLLRKAQLPSHQTLFLLSKLQPRTSLLRTSILSSNHDFFLNQCPGSMSCPSENDAAENALIRLCPSFPPFISLEPFSRSGNFQFDAEQHYGGEDDGPTMWADSVKKKRKRKMNKHKYRKLRKRLRRQT
ncbi:uncharacterized protein LOC110036007 [Phalaenopsis equestris]|uniref:uncharacterized protein LOC110036007 n=1 Tax=Phalaenopsis equestris TaxID=78828 RepID=UPI0009E57DD6|nr:uncharacterized protein LOC110036007 [Phalaenopsis equestris]XP_020596012.1 uncharacterized protein LOC110036007 [Phalaenopsis equestris]